MSGKALARRVAVVERAGGGGRAVRVFVAPHAMEDDAFEAWAAECGRDAEPRDLVVLIRTFSAAPGAVGIGP